MSKCKVCRTPFVRRSMTHKTCSVECAMEWIRIEKDRKERQACNEIRKETRERLEKLKTRSDYQKEAQKEVNAYVRDRDAGLPCISCGIRNPKQWHAGHYLSRGAHPELALEERNIHRQCSQCNEYLSGNQIEFRKGLIARYGVDEVEWLEGPHAPKKYTIDELKQIKEEFKLKRKQLLREREAA